MKNRSRWEASLFELIHRTSVDLPADVEAALRRAYVNERRSTHGRWILETILANVEAARRHDAPLCQDTGSMLFYFGVPAGFDTNALVSATRLAVERATECGYLRENTLDSVTGAPYPTNVAYGAPCFHFEQNARSTVDVRLILKGGGSENVGCQYSLPDTALEAGRDLEGARRCVLDAVVGAQGYGCAPGILGVCIGGDRASGYAHSKEQFLRRLDDRPRMRVLARLERRLLKECQSLGVGPMGLGGVTTILGVKVGALSRVPASFFVTVSYMCWAFRRRGVLLGLNGGVRRWLY
jgi:fumarate hydratase class I